MKVRAKFYVDSVKKHTGGAVTVELRPVTSGSEENKSFWKYTPGGLLTMNLNAGIPAADAFEPGQEFYLDFTPVAEAEVVGG